MGRALRFAFPINLYSIVQYQEIPEVILHLWVGLLQVLPLSFCVEVLFLLGLGHTQDIHIRELQMCFSQRLLSTLRLAISQEQVQASLNALQMCHPTK